MEDIDAEIEAGVTMPLSPEAKKVTKVAV